MASDTALVLVNRIFRTTGDYGSVATVVGSPSDIAERAIDFLNIALKDLTRLIDFDVLAASFTGTGDGINSQYISSGILASPDSAISVTVDTNIVEEVSRKKLNEMRDSQQLSGVPTYFCRVSDANNNLGVDIYPLPASGATIKVLAQQTPTLFTVADASTTEIDENELLVLGAIAHMDSFSGMERGYMQLYEASKNNLWVKNFSNQGLRVTTESYA